MPFSDRLARLRTPGRNRARLPFPAAPGLRVAQMAPRATFDAVEAFAFHRWQAVEAFRPQVLVGPALALHMLAVRVQEKTLDLSSVDHAIFVSSECGVSTLTDTARVVLWQAFGVPVYELFTDGQGQLLGSECEMHDGWHVEPHVKFETAGGEVLLPLPRRHSGPLRLAAKIETSVCACGRAGARILPAERKPAARAGRTLAATA
ncbi:MAG: hypothetical protein ACRD3Y_00200 [Bryobacteraceae bacterium]